MKLRMSTKNKVPFCTNYTQILKITFLLKDVLFSIGKITFCLRVSCPFPPVNISHVLSFYNKFHLKNHDSTLSRFFANRQTSLI